MVRLRRLLDSDASRQWFDENLNGNRFHFGRYTSAAQPSSHRPDLKGARRSKQAEQQLADNLRQIQETQDSLAGEDEGSLFHFPRAAGAEALTRWDMQVAPPDVLVTNFPMLSIMLGREDEEHLWESTRRWLASSPDHKFTLVVDELHLQRGTAGTETAYLLRRLLSRLGLRDNPSQLSVIATSASLPDNVDSERFLAQFFDRDEQPFEIFDGEYEYPSSGIADSPGLDPETQGRLTQIASGVGPLTEEEVTEAHNALGHIYEVGLKDQQPMPEKDLAQALLGDREDARSLL